MGCCGSKQEESNEPRVLNINTREGNNFSSNYIRTTNYTLITFLPLNLMEQFKKMSNIFFLINMIIALIPGVSPVFPATTILPLVVVVGAAAVRDAYEDYHRYQSDKRANALQVKVIDSSGKITSVASKDVHVGDVIYLERGAEIPVDCFILSTALPDGAAFVETANLDGETNLKPKQSRNVLHKLFQDPSSVVKLSGTIICDPPGVSMHKWLGKISCPLAPEQSADMDNFLLRGCTVRNVDWVMGVTVYTGVDTKMFRNLIKKPPKASRLDQKLNRLILMILAVQQAIILVICGLSIMFRDSTQGSNAWYLPFIDDQPVGLNFLLSYLTYFILLSLMMPISLFVSLEFCKTAQAKIMEWDEEFECKQGSMKARTSSLNEELSQVQYIFTDKTGTLTDNEMRFAKCFCGNQEFDELKSKGNLQKFINTTTIKEYRDQVANFLRLLSFCNTVVINVGKNGEITYDGSSTDEVALVGSALKNGYRLLSRTSDSMTVEIQHQVTTVEVVTIVPFTPERKMMSVVLREKDNTIRLYTKGADSSVMARLQPPRNPQEAEQRQNAQKFLDACADSGLRTLACGQRIFSPDEFESWKAMWDEACLTTTEDRPEKVHAAALAGETNLEFVGCTAIEDRLQDEVPETIHFLLRCGIVIWVLTGDKRETALNIAGTSRLLNPKLDLVVHLNLDTGIPMQQQLEDAIDQVEHANNQGRKSTFIVDGRSLDVILEPATYDLFLKLGLMVSSAVCCRVTPLQKSLVVKMFKNLGNTCLGVGDGANDVSMIQEARVGIGILGLEGSQAERASDYAIPRFRHLRRLLAVHGRYSLIRNSNLIQYSFYKNICYALTQIFYSFYNGFSGQTAYDSWVIIFFNIAFTFLPPMVMGILDFDVRANYLLRHPGLYSELRSPFAVRMSRSSSFLWLVLSLFHAIIIYYGVFRGAMLNDVVDNGRSAGMWVNGTTLMSTLICVVVFQAAISFLSWTWIHLASIVLSFLSYTVFIFIYGALPPKLGVGEYYTVPSVTYAFSTMWLNIVLWTAVFAAPQLGVLMVRRSWFGIHMHRARVSDYLAKKALPWQTPAGGRTSLSPAAASAYEQLKNTRTAQQQEQLQIGSMGRPLICDPNDL